MDKLLIIESPNKIKTLTKYLDNQYKIIATIGHIRDLSSFGMGFDKDTFEPKWIVPKPKGLIKNETPKEEVYIPSITVGSTFTGTMSGYGSDIGDLTASEYNISETIYYEDSTYGSLRILASDNCIPFGTVIEVSNSKIGSFKAIVLDRGGNIGFDRLYDFDLLFETSKEAMNYGSSLY